MKKVFLIFVVLMVSFSSNLAYANTYSLETNDESFEISYELNGDVIAMAIDKELTSLLVGITNVQDSDFEILLSSKLISAEDNEFAVLVNGVEVDYTISTQNDVSILRFFVPAGSEEIEIIGTHVIPEFPLGTLLVLATMIVIVTLVTKTSKFRIR